MIKNLILTSVLLFCWTVAIAQEPLPPGFEQNARKLFDKLPANEIKDISFDNFLLNEKAEFQRLKNLEKKVAAVYQPTRSKSNCGNGGFEGLIDASEWTGGYGLINISTKDPDWGTLTGGILTGRQTLVTSGPDGQTGIPRVHSGSNALLIGNTSVGRGTELISKTFTVDATNPVIRFWYAVVFQDPSHAAIDQPSFWVRVLNSSGTYVPGLVNLGMGSDKLVSSSNLFFKQIGDLRYKDWTCAEIQLGNFINQQVTVQFIVEDCGLGAHYGYAYLDDFCGSCEGTPDGNISLVVGESDCSKGKVCVKYTLPTVGGTTTLTLDFLQNGVSIGSPITAGPFSTNGTHCFQFDPCKLKGINTSLAGFDYMVNATFTALGAPPKTIGSLPNGQTGTKNDDCRLNCGNKTCCPDLKNLIVNTDFATNTAINSTYQYNSSTTADAVKPGQYSIVNSTGALSICKNWNAPDHTTCSSTGTVMVVNGRTGQTGKKEIWKQTIAIQKDKSYSFCGNFRNMSVCCFDILPKVDVRFSIGSGSNDLLNETINESPGCNWRLLKKQFNSGTNTSVTISVWLEESGVGDGNDVAMDDFSLNEIPQATIQQAMFGMNTNTIVDLGNGTFSFGITAVNPIPTGVGDCGVWYEVCELNANKNCVSTMTVSNPSVWWPIPGYPMGINFPGFDGSLPNASTLQPLPFNNITSQPGGIFLYSKSYRIRRGVFCDCLAWKDYSIDINSTINGRVRAVDSKTGELVFEKQIKK